MWDHLTAKVVNSKPHMSTRVQKEFNCKEETTRQIYASAFTDNMTTKGVENGNRWRHALMMKLSGNSPVGSDV